MNTASAPEVIIDASDVHVHFAIGRGSSARTVRAVDGVSISVRQGETLGLVGESGSGKSTLLNSLIGAVDVTEGTVNVCGAPVQSFDRKSLAKRVQMVFQDPGSSLNPRKTIGWSVEEMLVIHGIGSRAERAQRVDELLALVGLPNQTRRSYPHQLSGGQKQRVSIARAIALDPGVLLCDEPVSALDVSIQTQVLSLLLEIQRRLDVTVVFVAHDLAVVKRMSHRVAVMYVGKIVEVCDADELVLPRHPYTKALISAIPSIDEEPGERILLGGELPDPANPPEGCRFQTRCPWAQPLCREEEPPLRASMPQSNHRVACHFDTEIAAGLDPAALQA